MRCIPLRKNVSLEQGASLIVNPLTVVAFFDMIKRGRHAAIVNNAAASALGRMIIRLGQRSGVRVINIVRRQEQADLLRALGSEYVLDSSDDRFAPALRDLAHRLRATIAFDAVGGKETHTIVDAVPPGSTVVVYAGLAGEPSVFNPRTLAGEDKRIVGFYLANWMTRRGLVGMVRDIWRVQKLVAAELQTTIRGRFPLSAAQTALDSYRSNMTAGKVLLVADPEQVPIAMKFASRDAHLTFAQDDGLQHRRLKSLPIWFPSGPFGSG
jgi:NADPH:quinone reductase-like Zn-dependent oxidoreductase